MSAAEQNEETFSEHEIRNILLLENDKEFLDTLKELLESRGFLVTIAENGVDGLREVMELDFEIIICDLLMPKMPGDMFYLAVQRAKPHLCARFIFITGHGGDPKFEKFLDDSEGVALMKPFAMEDLIDTIGMVLSRTSSIHRQSTRST